ncbi:MAG: restriction endonuclease subunit S [Sulfuritalea sp.]|nr:restriction endonuclease subunit S [Sulfuritalea sp.]MCF8185008.1 restriction endonuclease subunit S [Polynucleobacter sp.]
MSTAVLGEICRTTSGGTPSRKRSDFFNGSIPWVKSGELTDGLVSEVEEFVTEEAIASSSAKVFPAGTLLIALYGATVGKLGILSRAAATNQAVCAVFPPSDLDTKFLFWNLRHRRADLIAQAVGGAQPNISQTILRNLEIHVPTLDSQREIVAEIEKQFSRLDEAVAGLKRVKANLKRYKAAILKAAVEGRLVPTEADLAYREGRRYETGAQLLQRILETRRSQWQGKGKYKEPAAPDTTGLPESPEGWAWTSIDQLAKVGTGATPQRDRIEYYQNGDIPWVTSAVVNQSYVDRATEFVTTTAFAKTNLTIYPAGTLLVAMYGEGKTRGKCAELRISAATNQALAALEASADVRGYLRLFLEHNYEETRKFASGGVQPNLNLSLVRSIRVPLPPVDEQHRIVAEVDRLLSIAREAEAEVDSSLKRAHGLRHVILQREFELR